MHQREAILEQTVVLRRDAQPASYYHDRAFSQSEHGEFARALADYSHAVALDPTNAFHRAGRGLIHQILGRWDDAIADFSAAIALYPPSASTHGLVGLYQARGKCYALRAGAAANRGNEVAAQEASHEAAADFTRAREALPGDRD